MRQVDPYKHPNQWLELTLLRLIEERKPENQESLNKAIYVITHWLEPGLIDDLFGHWMEDYKGSLNEDENNHNNFDSPCSFEDPSE